MKRRDPPSSHTNRISFEHEEIAEEAVVGESVSGCKVDEGIMVSPPGYAQGKRRRIVSSSSTGMTESIAQVGKTRMFTKNRKKSIRSLKVRLQHKVVDSKPHPVQTRASQNLPRRSKTRSPDEEMFLKLMPDYNAWLASRTVAGHRAYNGPQLKQHRNKYRTLLGKIAKFFDVDMETLLVGLDDSHGWELYFEKPKLEELSRSLEFSDHGRPLKLGTVYNLVVEMDHYLYWQVKTRGRASMKKSYKLVRTLKEKLAEDKHQERDPEEKAAHVQKLPNVPEILKLLDGSLKTRMEKARRKFAKTGVAKWGLYSCYRNYVLVLLLFVVPPQRKQVYDMLDIRDITLEDKCYLLSSKEYKTAYKYRPVIIAIPEDHMEVFEEYLTIRNGVAQTGVTSLFVNMSGVPEKYLTKVFQTIIWRGLAKTMNILDCRSVYITYANSIFKKDQMATLAARMYHSFDTQQRYYESTSTRAKAVPFLTLAKELTGNTKDPLPAIQSIDGATTVKNKHKRKRHLHE